MTDRLGYTEASNYGRFIVVRNEHTSHSDYSPFLVVDLEGCVVVDSAYTLDTARESAAELNG